MTAQQTTYHVLLFCLAVFSFSPIIIAVLRRHPKKWSIIIGNLCLSWLITPIPFIVWACRPIPLTLELSLVKFPIPEVSEFWELLCNNEAVYRLLHGAYVAPAGNNGEYRQWLTKLTDNQDGWTRARYAELARRAKQLRRHTLSQDEVLAVFNTAGARALQDMFGLNAIEE